jgi:hypothetical protein
MISALAPSELLLDRAIYLVATLYFDSLDAAAADLANFADGGADLYFFDTKDV